MSVKVYVKDFRSIGEASLEISGFTIIRGKNNLGKSNLWRALNGLFHNKADPGFVREGSKSPYSVVEVSFEDGNIVRWEKGEKDNRYFINGSVLDKVGRGAPDPVRALGVGSIEIAGEQWSPQFAQQFVGQLFLVDRPGSFLAEAISDVDSVARINGALTLAEKDRRAGIAKAKIRKQDLKGAEDKLLLFEGLDLLKDTFSTLKEKRSSLLLEKSDLQGLFELSEALTHTQEICLKLGAVKDLEAPDKSLLLEMSGSLLEAKDLLVLIKGAKDQVATFSGLEECTLPSLSDLPEIQAELFWLKKTLLRRDKLLEIVQGEDSEALSKGEEILSNINVENCTKLSRAYGVYSELLKELKKSKEALLKIKKEISLYEEELKCAEKELEDLLEELGVCPTCGKDTGSTHEHD